MTDPRVVDTPAAQWRIDSLRQSGALRQLDKLIRDAKALAHGRASWDDKADGMVTLATKISDTLTPHLACAKGCNHCCYMATAVSAYEADMISRYLGRDKAAVGVSIIDFERHATVTKFAGTACTLLGEDGRCTVYPVRPIACRNHHNLGADESNCVIAGHDYTKTLPTTPSINLDEFLFYHAEVYFQQPYADIREWFPAKQQGGGDGNSS